MSEAESLNQSCDGSQPTEFVAGAGAVAKNDPVVSTPPDPENNSWQTVNFPGAIELDSLPIAEQPGACSAPITDLEVASALASLNQFAIPDGDSTPPAADLPADPHVESLQQENRLLQDRITELETDLTQQQIELQLERSRSLHTQPEGLTMGDEPAPANLTVALQSTQEQLTQVFQELELSQQATQRQQILVETLSEQLESSQERIAQLERDCALAQQRHNEQVQKRLQAEDNCRDLRMRLHRQQRQTLQFKAALEKCLEMPPAQGQPAPGVETVATPPIMIPPIAASQVNTPKNQPVKPWSAILDASSETVETGLAKPLAKIVHLHSGSPAEAVVPGDDPPSDQTEQGDDWAEQLFAAAGDTATYGNMASEQASTIFDPSLLMEGETAGDIASGETPIDLSDIAGQAASSQLGDDGLLKMLASVPLDSDAMGTTLTSFWERGTQDDPLWDDLEKLIERPGASAAEQPAATSLEVTESIRADGPVVVATTQPKKSLELVSWGTAPTEQREAEPEVESPDPIVPVEATPLSARSFAVKPAAKPLAATGASALNVELLTLGSPSPVVYPLRPSKKLKSLAAVELPTFPRSR